MISIELMRPASLKDTGPGDLFVSLDHHKAPFLAGSIGEIDVLVALRSEGGKFRVGKRASWVSQTGYLIPGVRIEVDRSEATLPYSESDLMPGEVVLFPGGYGICGGEDHGNHLVELSGALDSDQGRPTLVGFRRWELVVGEGIGRQVLYHFTGKELLFGAFDPEADEEA